MASTCSPCKGGSYTPYDPWREKGPPARPGDAKAHNLQPKQDKRAVYDVVMPGGNTVKHGTDRHAAEIAVAMTGGRLTMRYEQVA